MRSYAAARSLLSFLETVLWCMVALGAIAAMVLADQASSRMGGGAFIGAMPGLIMALLAFLGVANVQHARAGVDCAEYGQQALQVARDQLKISKQALKQQEASNASFAQLAAVSAEPGTASYGRPDLAPTTKATDTGSKEEHRVRYLNFDCTSMEYRGRRIEQKGETQFVVGGATYTSLEAAKLFVDQAISSGERLSSDGPENDVSDPERLAHEMASYDAVRGRDTALPTGAQQSRLDLGTQAVDESRDRQSKQHSPTLTSSPPEVVACVHNEWKITEVKEGYRISGATYASLDEAKRRAERMGPAVSKLPGVTR